MADQTPPPSDDHEQQEGEVQETTPAAAEEPIVEEATPAADAPEAAGTPAADEATAAPAPASEAAAPAADAPAPAVEEVDDDEDEEPTPRVKPAIPGADLEVDIVTDSDFGRSPYDEDIDPDAEEPAAEPEDEADTPDDQPIVAVEINLAADARYRATGKRKTAVARVTLRPGTGAYVINGKTLDIFFPRPTLQRTIRQPLETVGYEERMDVVARLHGGGVSAQAGALRHGISRALLEADPNLRVELKRRGFLTRDSRVKERKKAGLKKARKRPQFSKR